MKFLKFAVAAVFAVVYGNAYAFHSGGVGECEGCHSMHNSFEGSANVTGMAQYQSGPFLLKAQDQSGACLNCHAEPAAGSYHISSVGINPLDSTAPYQMTPGGDFAWLKKTMTGSIRNTLTTWEGDRKGHNIIATDFGYTADKTLTVAPGSSTGYPAGTLACSSCHDPHGKYRRDVGGNIVTTGLPIKCSGSYNNGTCIPDAFYDVGVYRLLGGVGYQPKSLAGALAFTNPPPSAVAPSSYNGANTTIGGTFDRVAYGSGMSEWCANCHTVMHSDTAYASGTTGQVHPAGSAAKLTAAIATNYSAYISSGIMTGGSAANYSPLAPFETGNGQLLADYVALKSFQTTPTAPVAGTSQVTCLSCHRAHASGFESMARYYLGNEFMTIGDSAGVASYDSSTTENKINTGYTVAQQTNAYNGRPATVFGPYARNYCNKCHAKD
jgi:hypothetical protein